jgi:hypothetical protein
MLGISITGQRLLKKKILVSLRTPEDVTIEYPRRVRTVAKNATINFVFITNLMHVCFIL